MSADVLITEKRASPDHYFSPEKLSKWLVRRGPLFIKLGQFLALRPDILPQAYIDELIKLSDRVPFFPWPQAKAVLTEELGCDPYEVFISINSRPIGAGSLAQVHLARLYNGEEVAIKILRPGIDLHIEKNLKNARLLLRLLALGPLKLPVSPKDLIDELAEWLHQEIDLTIELKNLSELHSFTQGNNLQKIPRPYPQWCTRRILVTESMQGIPMTDVMRLVAEGDTSSLQSLQIDPATLAKNLLLTCLTQMFDYRFFHMDLHPGNLFVLPDNVLGFVDFGLCGYLDSTVNARQIRYFSAVFSGNSENMHRAVMEILETDDSSDEEAFKRDFYAHTSVWQASQKFEKTTGNIAVEGIDQRGAYQQRRSKTGQWLIQVMRSSRRSRMKIPVSVLAMYRAILTAESVAFILDSQSSLANVGRKFFIRHQTAEISRSLTSENLQPLLISFINVLKNSPGQIERILADLADRKLTINTAVTDTNKNKLAANRRYRLVSLCVTSVGFCILLTVQELPVIFGLSIRSVIVAALLVNYIWIAILWRKMR